MTTPPVSRTPSPQPPPDPKPNERQRSFPIDWFFDENAAPVSEKSMEAAKPIKPKVKQPKKPILSPYVQVYKNMFDKENKS